MTRLRRTLARRLRVLADRLDPSPRIVSVARMPEEDATALREAMEASQRRAAEDFRLPRRRTRPADPHSRGCWEPAGRPHRPGGGIR